MVSESDLIEIQRLAQEGKIGQALIYVENLCEQLDREAREDGHREGWQDGYSEGWQDGNSEGWEEGYVAGQESNYD